MKDTRRALRRHHRQRLIARAMESSVLSNYPEEERRPQAVRWFNNMQKCACYMCGHQRQKYGPTIQELRQLQRVKPEYDLDDPS